MVHSIYAYTTKKAILDVIILKKLRLVSGIIILLLIQSPAIVLADEQQWTKVIPISDQWIQPWRSAEAVEDGFKDIIDNIMNNTIVLTDKIGEELFVSTYEQMGVSVDIVRMDQGIWQNLKQPYGFKLTIDEQKACTRIRDLYDHYLDKPKDAFFKFDYNNQVTIEPEQSGELFNDPAMLKAIRDGLQLQGPIVLPILTEAVTPKVTADYLEKLNIHELWGSYSTQFNGGDTKRTTNIWLASTAIDDYILMPGETFSFNTVVGPRTQERGYQLAGVIVNNQKTKDVGGGVCQVSSTLYNAAKDAKLSIIEAHRHTIPVHYVPKGQDAAVVYGEKDLKFKNTTQSPIVIKPYFAYGRITFKLFGDYRD